MTDTSKPMILVVDDQPDNIILVTHAIRDLYSIKAATSGEKALKIATTIPEITLILLDVIMPEMDGYETCRRLKENPLTSHIPVIFVSAMDTLEHVVSGYESGGNDYTFKPIQPLVLRQKIKLAIESTQQLSSVKNEKEMAVSTAMTAMTSSGEQGVVIGFMRKSLSINTVKNLGKHVIDSVSQYNLNSSVQLRTSEGICNVSKDSAMSPLEEEFLTRLKSAGRLGEKGKNFIVNYSNITLLIKNMPVEDDDKRGRLRDHLALLLEAASARLESLVMQEHLINVVDVAKQSLKQIEELQMNHKQNAVGMMDNVLRDLEASFMSYGLTEDQEDKLTDIVSTAVDDAIVNFEEGLKIDEKLRDIVASLERFTDS